MEGVASGCPLFRGKYVHCSAVGTVKSVRCPEFRGGRFSEVANVLHKWDFQSVTCTLSALGSVSASLSVCSGRFYCTTVKNHNRESTQNTLRRGWDVGVPSVKECSPHNQEWIESAFVL